MLTCVGVFNPPLRRGHQNSDDNIILRTIFHHITLRWIIDPRGVSCRGWHGISSPGISYRWSSLTTQCCHDGYILHSLSTKAWSWVLLEFKLSSTQVVKYMVGGVGAMAVMQIKSLLDLSQREAKIDRDLRGSEKPGNEIWDLRVGWPVRRMPVRLPSVQFHHVDTSCKFAISAALALLTRVKQQGALSHFSGSIILLFLFQDSVI